MSSKRIDKIRDALEAIRRQNGGRLTREAVVKTATNSRHILHREFVWNNKRAAHLQRLDRAQELITRYVTVVVIDRSMKIVAPAYVKDPTLRTNESGYTSITAETIKAKDAQQIVLVELDRCASCISRARNIAAVLDIRHRGVSDQLEDMLTQLVAVRRALAA
jgi:hypothetical protein